MRYKVVSLGDDDDRDDDDRDDDDDDVNDIDDDGGFSENIDKMSWFKHRNNFQSRQ